MKPRKSVTPQEKILSWHVNALHENYERYSMVHNVAEDGLRSRKKKRELMLDHLETERYE